MVALCNKQKKLFLGFSVGDKETTLWLEFVSSPWRWINLLT